MTKIAFENDWPEAGSFLKYQDDARRTAIYPGSHDMSKTTEALTYTTLGLVGEAGEVANKVKKIIRDKGGKVSIEDLDDLAYELGDVLWYIANLAFDLGISLETVADMNIAKLKKRAEAGTIGGSGDSR